MSPEQARDESHRVGPHSDVWAVGVVLYECLTGRVPFVGETAVEVLTAVCEAPIDFEGVPEAYVPLLRDALGRTPDVRIATLSEFRARIEEIGVARPSPPPEPVALSTTPSSSIPSKPSTKPPSFIPSKTNLTLTGLGPGELSSAERISIAADAELESVPVRSHRKALLGGLAVAIIVAVSAWWSVRDFGREPALLLGPSLAEREVLPRLGASDRDVGAEPVEETASQATEQVPAEPVAEVTAEPVAEVTAEPVAEVTAEPVAEAAVAPVEEADAELDEAAAAEPSEDAPSDSDVESAEAVTETPEATAARRPASPTRPKSRSVRRKKPPSPDRSRSAEPPELVTEW